MAVCSSSELRIHVQGGQTKIYPFYISSQRFILKDISKIFFIKLFVVGNLLFQIS
jgi:hypothetical protein